MLLFLIAAPMVLPFAWQLIHGHKAHLQQTELELQPGWIVLRGSVVKPTQNLFLGNQESDLIAIKRIEKCQPPSSTYRILAMLKKQELGQEAASDETWNIGGKIVPCYSYRPNPASPRNETSCVALDNQVVVTILATPEARNEALDMLHSLRETKPCTP
jgi:hypothetical protein